MSTAVKRSPSPPEHSPPTTATSSVPLYSFQYFALCGIGGAIACGPTHTLMCPLDVVKCNAQVDPKSTSARALMRGLQLHLQWACYATWASYRACAVCCKGMGAYVCWAIACRVLASTGCMSCLRL